MSAGSSSTTEGPSYCSLCQSRFFFPRRVCWVGVSICLVCPCPAPCVGLLVELLLGCTYGLRFFRSGSLVGVTHTVVFSAKPGDVARGESLVWSYGGLEISSFSCLGCHTLAHPSFLSCSSSTGFMIILPSTDVSGDPSASSTGAIVTSPPLSEYPV